MNEPRSASPLLYMAPLKGITDALFRRVYHTHFHGLDGAVAPFINPQRCAAHGDKLLADLLPEQNTDLPLVPQIINNEPEGFLALASLLADLGYREMNWNLGCPVRMVAKKARGSGLLPYPDRIIGLLDTVIPRLRLRLSIKMRLGFANYHESENLLPRLNDYPLSQIIIHPRLGTQLYNGHASLARFKQCSALTRHPLVYNGDLTNLHGYHERAAHLPGVNRWMIGRGLLANPFLPEEIKGTQLDETERVPRLAAFHDELYAELAQRLSGPGHLLGRMKQIWIYLIEAFPGREKALKTITRTTRLRTYREAVRAVMS